MDNVTLVMLTLFIVGATLIVIVLNIIQGRKNKRIKKTIEKLEIEKNELATSPIIPELAKVEAYLNNDKLKAMYDEWSGRLKQIKDVSIPKLSDMILDAEYALSQQDYKSTMYKIAKLEMELYKVRTSSDFLFGEIRDLTSSEERSRTIITGYKAKYRTLYQKFEETKSEYGQFANVVQNQFEIIAKHFEGFEKIMDTKDFAEVNDMLNNINELLNHMSVVIEEVPSIVIMINTVIPKKMEEAITTYQDMVSAKYPLDYLNFEYNIEEAYKKLKLINDRTSKLDMNESMVEIQALSEYFDELFKDFEKEKNDKKIYEEKLNTFNRKLNKINIILREMFNQLDDIKTAYDLKETDITELNNIRKEVEVLNENLKVLYQHTENNTTFAYSKLVGEVEGLSNDLSHTQNKLDTLLNVIGNMHDDEARARQQLEEIKMVLKDAKFQIKQYNLPFIPESYYVELDEANAAIKEIVKELDRKPIKIEILNTRVDTARDLVLKLYTKTRNLIKNAMFAEKAIVYGNRYRSSYEEVDRSLNISEQLFHKGDYKKSFEYTINVLDKIEPGIYDKILNLYGQNSKSTLQN